MSDDNKNLPQGTINLAEEPKTDLSSKELAKVNQFIEEGMPGLAKIDEGKMHKIMDLYLSGKTYTDIATIVRTNKTLILYLSNKFNWPSMRHDYLVELETSMKGRVLESKAASQDHMLKIIHMFEKRHGDKINQYLASGDEDIVKSIDLKEMDKYFKVVEMLHSMNADPKAPKGPMVGINTGDGVTIKKTGENSLEITPNTKDKTIGSMLKQFADSRRREEQNNKLPKKHDIVDITPDKQGDNINEND